MQERKETLKELVEELKRVVDEFYEKLIEQEGKPETKPHIKSVITDSFFGNLGDTTNYKDAIGRPLFIGDIVEHFDKDNESYGETVICKNDNKVFVMGIEVECNDKTGETGDWKIIKKRSFDEVADGEIVFDCIKYFK